MESLLNSEEELIKRKAFLRVLAFFHYNLEGLTKKQIYDAAVGICRDYDLTNEQVNDIADEVYKEVLGSKEFIEKFQDGYPGNEADTELKEEAEKEELEADPEKEEPDTGGKKL